MKGLIVLAAVVAAAHAWGTWKEGLSVRFDVGLGAGRTFFIPLPQTVREAKNARWVQSTRAPGLPMPSLTLYTPSTNDVIIGTLYDTNGDVAGLQIALPQDSISGFPLDFGVQGYTEWTAPPNSAGVSRKYWVTTQYFVSEATLAKSPAERAASRKGRVLQEDHIYLTGFNGELLPVPTTAKGVAATAFTRQSCIPFMGRHYFYNSSKTSECTSDTLLPWFTLVDGSADQLIASGLVTFGKLPVSSIIRDYFERPATSAVRAIVSDGPDCLYQLSDQYGALTMHIYYVDSPLLISCIGM